MIVLEAALDQLIAEEAVIRQRASLPKIDGIAACKGLRSTVEKLRIRHTEVKFKRPKLDPDTVWNKFVTLDYKLSSLDSIEFRTLCCCEETALRSQFVAELAKDPTGLNRSRCLYGLVNCYFTGWRTMMNPEVLERLLTRVMASYSSKNPVVKKWRECPPLFTENASSALGEGICLGQKSVEEILTSYYIGTNTKLGIAVRSTAARAAVDYLTKIERGKNDEWTLQYLQWLTAKVLSGFIESKNFSYAMGKLILSESAKRSEGFQRALRSFIQNDRRLGDPRVRETAANWRSMEAEAAQRYLSWLARDSITFFFNTILPNNDENRRRKEFWLRYHDRITDFQVALSNEDLQKVKAGSMSHDLLYYSLVDHLTTSAFLMKFEGYSRSYAVIEFSESGNAAYIYTMKDFETFGVTLRSPRYSVNKHLKVDKTHRIFHRGAWEDMAAAKLASEFGIRP